MENVLEFVLLGVGLILLSIFIFSAVNLTNVGSRISKSFSDMLNNRTASIVESENTQYQDCTLTGSEVVSAVRKFRSSIIVKVEICTSVTDRKNLSTEHEYELGGSFQNIPTSENYINPEGEFTCEVVRNANGVIVGMNFEQKKYVAVVPGMVEVPSPSPGSSPGGGTPYAAGGAFASYPGAPTSLAADSASEPVGVDEQVTQSQDDSSLDVEFSDEQSASGSSASEDNSSQINTEDAQSLQSVSQEVASYGSELDDLIGKVSALDVNCTPAEVKEVKTSLLRLAGKVEVMQGELSEYKLSKTQEKKLNSALTTIAEKVAAALVTATRLEKSVSEGQDKENLWYIGYPVKSDVKAVLKNGTLTFSGTGEASIGHDLPKWLKKAKEIKRVVFGSKVKPINLDYWFTGCNALKSVEALPNSVISINGTFNGCSSLSGSIRMGGEIESANGVFNECNNRITVSTSGKTAKTLRDYLKITKKTNVTVKD